MIEVNKDFTASVAHTIAPEKLTACTVLEHLHAPARRTVLYRLSAGESINTSDTGSEIVVLEGDCHSAKQHFGEGYYLRFSNGEQLTTNRGCVLFEKSDQYLEGDSGNRVIDTHASHLWLPGPVDGISICPLHVFDSESIMLLKWEDTTEFKPRLDPQGEELLVINGLLKTGDSSFKPYSWIRNPVYYKSGHFPNV
jgi:hypothetical protein